MIQNFKIKLFLLKFRIKSSKNKIFNNYQEKKKKKTVIHKFNVPLLTKKIYNKIFKIL